MGEILSVDGFILQNIATSGNGVALDLRTAGREVSFYTIWSAGVTAGQVTIETADSRDYSGTWALVNTVNFGADRANLTQVTGVFHFMRARISTNVTGGTVTVKVYAN